MLRYIVHNVCTMYIYVFTHTSVQGKYTYRNAVPVPYHKSTIHWRFFINDSYQLPRSEISMFHKYFHLLYIQSLITEQINFRKIFVSGWKRPMYHLFWKESEAYMHVRTHIVWNTCSVCKTVRKSFVNLLPSDSFYSQVHKYNPSILSTIKIKIQYKARIEIKIFLNNTRNCFNMFRVWLTYSFLWSVMILKLNFIKRLLKKLFKL